MAERTVSVRLKAVTDQYVSAMRGAGKATADVASSGDKWQKLGQSTASLGSTLTRNVTLPIVAVGAAAVKMASDFDKPFQQMHQLAGVAANEIDGLKESVLELAGETGKAPQELAEALYFLRSSGLGSAQAMDALEMSAKASAAGLGSTVQIADAVSSAMNAYASSGLTAAEATDVLVATAKAGKAEPAELAAQMGRLLPVSSELGITFNDVGAALAALSISGNDAAASSTQLSNLMGKLLRPSLQAQEALRGVGIGLSDIRGMIAEKGLLGTLNELKDRLGNSGFVTFLEDTQAIQAGLALTGQNASKVQQIFDDLSDVTGETDSAFAKWSETMGAKNSKAWAQLQASLIGLGDTLAPIASDLFGMFSGLVKTIGELPGPAKTALLAFAGIAAASGPLLSVGGNIMQVYGKLPQVFMSFGMSASSASAATRALGNAAIVATPLAIGLGIAWADVARTKAEAKARTEELVDAMQQEAEGTRGATAEAVARGLAESKIGGILRDQRADVDTLVDGLTNEGDAIEVLDDNLESIIEGHTTAAERMEHAGIASSAFTDELVRLIDSGDLSAGQIRDLINSLDGESDRLSEAAAATEDAEYATDALGGSSQQTAADIERLTEALQQQADQLKAQFDPLFGMISANQGVRDAQLQVAEATRNLAEARREHGAGSAEAAQAARDLRDAEYGVGEAAYAQEQAMVTLAQAVNNGEVTVEGARAGLDRWIDSAGLTQSEALLLRTKFDELIGSAENYADDYNANVTQTGAEGVIRSVRGVEGSIEDVPRSHNTHVTETGSGLARRSIRAVEGSVEDVPRLHNTHVSTSGTGPARGALHGVRNAATGIPSSRSVRVTTNTGGSVSALAAVTSAVNRIPSSKTISIAFNVYGQAEANRAAALAGHRAAGGPVDAGRLYEVAEHGKAELMEMGGRTYLIPGNNGTVISASGIAGSPMGSGEMSTGSLDALVRTIDNVDAAVHESTDKQIAADSIHFHYLTGWMGTNITRYLDWATNGIETLIRMEQLGAKNVRWFEDLNSIPTNRQFADGGIVAKVHSGEMVLNGAQQARLWNMIESGNFTSGASAGGGHVANYNIDLRGALVPNGAEVEKAVFQAIARGGERGRPLTMRGRRL